MPYQYSPNDYRPTTAQPSFQYQPTVPYTYQPAPPQEPQNGFLWVGSRKEVDDYQMKPNQVMAFFHRDQKVFWFKTADSNGNAVTTTCDYSERDESDTSDEYATKKDVEDIKGMIQKMQEAWNG